MSFQMKKVELEEKLKLVESLNENETFELMNELGIKSTSGNELSRPIEFNLMFQCDIGPEGKSVGYLRPETAQGIFSNFKLLRLAFKISSLQFDWSNCAAIFYWLRISDRWRVKQFESSFQK